MATPSHAPHASPNLTGLRVGLVVTVMMMVAELLVGWYSGSLALLSDAGHMVSDAATLGIALLACQMARQPASRTKTFGYYRTEILAAFLNGLTLWVVAAFISYRAIQRLCHPHLIKAMPMMVTAVAGLGVNLLCGWILYRTKQTNLNLHGAFLHVMADALGSVSVVAAGLIIWRTGWSLVDPIASLAVCLMIVVGSWQLIAQSVNVLLEGSPPHIDVPTMMRAMRRVAGVTAVHDVHVWTITSGMDAMSGHVVVEEMRRGPEILERLSELLRTQFQVSHTTFQLEAPSRKTIEDQR